MIDQKKDLIMKLKDLDFSRKIVNAFNSVNREEFVPDELKELAYDDRPLPIGSGQTISQPYTVAFMLNLLEPKDNISILEIGSGSGYVLALLNQTCKESKIYGVERIRELAESAKDKLRKNENIRIFHRDGSNGLPQFGPFDRIIVSAAFDMFPTNLINQLKPNGVLVSPVRSSIVKIKRFKKEIKIMDYPGFVFVPIIHD